MGKRIQCLLVLLLIAAINTGATSLAKESIAAEIAQQINIERIGRRTEDCRSAQEKGQFRNWLHSEVQTSGVTDSVIESVQTKSSEVELVDLKFDGKSVP